MTAPLRRVGDVLRLERIAVEPDPGVEYASIGIRSFGKGIFHYDPKPGDQLGSLRFFELRPERLVVSNIKGWEGAIAVSAEVDAGTIASNRFLTYVPVDDEIDVRWACWYFLSDRGIAQIQRASPGSADRNRTLAIDRFEALEIPLPRIDEQRRIARSIDHLQGASSTLMQLVTRAEVLSDALGVSLVFRADLTESERTKAGWRTWMLNDVLVPEIHEVDVAPGSSYQIAGVYSFGRGMFSRATIDGTQTSYKKLHRVTSGQIVMSRLKAWEGALALVPESLDGCYVSPEFPTFRVHPEVADAGFLSRVLTSELFWSRLQASSHGIGARRERVSAEKLLSHEVSLPPIEAQRSTVRTLQVAASARTSQQGRAPVISALVPAALNGAFGTST